MLGWVRRAVDTWSGSIAAAPISDGSLASVCSRRRPGWIPVVFARELGSGGRLATAPRRLPSLLASDQLLARLATVGSGAVNLRVWEQPWRRTYQLARHRRPQVARVPALGRTLRGHTQRREQSVCGRFLLNSDTGGPRRSQPFECSLAAWLTYSGRPASDYPYSWLLQPASRVGAWTRLVEQVSHARRMASLQVRDDLGDHWPGHAIKRLGHRARAGGRVWPRALARG